VAQKKGFTMPMYEYQCEACGHVTEALRRMGDADQALACENCGSDKTQRAQSVFAAGGSKDSAMPDLPMGGGCACGDPNGPCNA
jgi:putative FmdB family regulatory protein